MIPEPTVFILGAGASAPYGFPIGSGLKDKILEGLSNDVERGLYTSVGFTNEQIEQFGNILQISPYDTIDAILSFRPSIARIGKFSITKVLSVCQKHEKLFPPRDWYHHFFKRLELDNVSLPAPPITILTFNYDNSLEYFFETIIREMYEGHHQKRVLEKYNSIRIIHLHGRLGPFPSQGEDFITNLSTAIQQSDIRVISDEELDKAPEFTEAYSALSSASFIVFLGFGYAELNLRRLRIREIDSKTKIYGTRYKTDATHIKNTMGRDIIFFSEHHTCMNALNSLTFKQ